MRSTKKLLMMSRCREEYVKVDNHTDIQAQTHTLGIFFENFVVVVVEKA